MIRKIYSAIIGKTQILTLTELAGVQYLGEGGYTSPCLEAIARVLNSGEIIRKAYLVTGPSTHAFILSNEFDYLTVIKDGFTSGYPGEGPRGLAATLMLLERHKVEIDEYGVDAMFMERLGQSCLLQSDIDLLHTMRPVRPQRWHDYIYDQALPNDLASRPLSRHYPLALPFSIIDERIIDLAVSFDDNRDASILSAYRRLEDRIRSRTGIQGEGTKLFSRAFLADDCPLRWDVPDDAEGKGRSNLFNATYMAFRNARAHRESERNAEEDLREFMLINELYRLEAEALTELELIEKRREEAFIRDSMRYLQEKGSA